MPSHEQLTDLLVRWQEAAAEGRDLPAAQLCGGDPDLERELEQHIGVLRRLTRLATEVGQGVAQTDDGAAPVLDTVSQAIALPRIPDYEVLQEVGHGGMGVVYQARDLRHKRVVALKLLRHGEQATAEQRARFRAEAEAIARLQHPHIVQVFHAGEWRSADGATPTPFYAMEYVAGGSLAGVARQGPLPPTEVARLMLLLARAVHAAHQAGVIHRDLKPGNVLLAPPADEPALNSAWGLPKVSDFGLARLGEPGPTPPAGQTTVGTLLGTPAYMAPEQAEGRMRDIGPATDVWALGVMLYELLTGDWPFKDESSLRLMQKVCTEEPIPMRTRRPQVPAALAAIVERCLRKPPTERYPSAAALAEDLNRFLARGAIDLRPAPVLQRHGSPTWRKLALMLVLMALLMGTGFWLLPRPGPRKVETPPAIPPPFHGWIDILVSDPKNEQRRGLRLHEPSARPLRPGDEVRVEVGLKDRPGYVYVVWIDAKGRAIPIYPWLDLAWDKRPETERPVIGRLLLPEDGTVYPIEPSPPGMETLLMLVRDAPLQADVDLAARFAGLGEVGGTDREYMRWFENGRFVTGEPNRSPGGRIEASDPAERVQSRLRQRLGELFPFSRAVCFFNEGR
jgi:serine/threonine protein kinase